MTSEKLADYPPVPSWMVLSLSVYVAAWYLQIGTRWSILGAVRFEFILASLLIVATVFRWLGGAARGQSNQPLVAWTWILVVILGLHTIFSVDPDRSWFIFSERVLKLIFIAVFIATFVKSPRHLRWILGALLFAWLKLGQEGLMGHITGGLMWQNQGIMRLHGSTGMIAHPNSFSGWALGTLPFVIYLYPVVRSRGLRALLILQALLSIHVLIFTGSRTGYVGVVALMLIIVWHSPKRVRTFTAIAMVAVVAFFAIPKSYLERAASIVTLEEAEGNSSGARIQILKDAWVILQENPLGVGVAGFPKARFERFGRLQDTHNLYLEVATNIGIHGLIVFGMFVFSMLRSLRRTRLHAAELLGRINGSKRLKAAKLRAGDLTLIMATARAVEAFILIRLTLGLFGMDLYEIYWWLALGFAISLRSILFNAQRIEEYSPSFEKL
ncbi:MAG: O-antigen ligase family protein [Acidobacteriota bacterium]|nr:O-antigen ligase family protein [Acidobacteriota bacterium]